MMANAYELPLRQGAEALGLTLNDTQIAQLLGYHALIQKWNKVYNLTAIRDPAEMLTHHLLDSLAIVAPLRIRLAGLAYEQDGAHDAANDAESSTYLYKLLDVGAGAGLPGVVLAICCPDIHVTCVDAVAKKMAFVQQVATELKLPNLQGFACTGRDFDRKVRRHYLTCVCYFAGFCDGFACGAQADNGRLVGDEG